MSKHFHRGLFLVALAISMAGCTTSGVTVPGGAIPPAAPTNAPFIGYEPIDPIATPKVYTLDSPVQGTEKLWAGMKIEDIRKLLPNQTSTTTIKRIAADGKVTFLTASTSAESGVYEVVMDYAKYRSEPVFDAGANPPGGAPPAASAALIGYGKIGVGVRIKANIQTLKAGVDLNGLFALGLAARAQQLKGTLSVDVIGIDSPGVNALLPVGVQLDESSIQASLQSLASIQTKIYDDKVNLTPHLIAIRRGRPLATAVSEGADGERAKLIEKLQGLPKR